MEKKIICERNSGIIMHGGLRVQDEVLQSSLMTQVAYIFFNDLKSHFSERLSS